MDKEALHKLNSNIFKLVFFWGEKICTDLKTRVEATEAQIAVLIQHYNTGKMSRKHKLFLFNHSGWMDLFFLHLYLITCRFAQDCILCISVKLWGDLPGPLHK